jgi:down-regulator of transcription 1
MSDNDDLCIPRSAMYKLVKELVPQVRLSSEAKDLIVTACNEFIHLLASESNTVCEKQSKKLILPDHVLLALDNLGFGEYKEDCVEVMKQMQEEVGKRKELRNKLKKPGIPEEELLRQQNALFAEARKKQQLMESAEEWSRVQKEAQLALQRQASNNKATGAQGSNHAASSNNYTNDLFNHSQNGGAMAAAANNNNNCGDSYFPLDGFNNGSSTFNHQFAHTNNNNNNNNGNGSITINSRYNKHDVGEDDDDNYD